LWTLRLLAFWIYSQKPPHWEMTKREAVKLSG
jgi:hypothetical protein